MFKPGEVEYIFTIEIYSDLILEQNELFDVVLTGVNGTGVSIGMPRAAEVLIINSDSRFLQLSGNTSEIMYYSSIVLTVFFSQEQYSVNESDGQVTVSLELGRPAGQNVTVLILAVPNTAQGYINHFPFCKFYNYVFTCY